ncbi:unnamed protein product [Cuscuta epithymum]|uniref:Uncharacterized protein n=2 Tax=Cuscuta epithymum TaxID=186058 RepID=A0AAV0CYY2_9ASTE|nr:unnamed protein product [Cuscuta epithymum]
MYAVRFLRLITTRSPLSFINGNPVYSPSRASYDVTFGHLIELLTKSPKPQAYGSMSKFRNPFHAQKCHEQLPKLKDQGGNFTWCNAVGLSALLGSISMWPRTAYAMDDFGAFLDDGHSLGLMENPKTKKDHRTFFVLLKKLIVPIFLVATIFLNLGHPLILAAKVTLILYMTKPSPLSIYLFVEEIRNQVICKHPFIFQFKSLYANKVEVEDYEIFCLATVELKEQKFTVVGFLGSWWVLPVSSSREDGLFSMLKDRFKKILS